MRVTRKDPMEDLWSADKTEDDPAHQSSYSGNASSAIIRQSNDWNHLWELII